MRIDCPTKRSDLIEQLSEQKIEKLEYEYFHCATPREDLGEEYFNRPMKRRKVLQQQAAEHDCVTERCPPLAESDDEEDWDDDEEVTQVRREYADPLPFGPGEWQDDSAVALPALVEKAKPKFVDEPMYEDADDEFVNSLFQSAPGQGWEPFEL